MGVQPSRNTNAQRTRIYKEYAWHPEKNLSGTFMQVPITLNDPLDDRAVIDRNTGKRILRSPAG